MSQLRIMLLDDRNVLVGYRYPHPEDSLLWILDAAAVVRRWGTESETPDAGQRGLGLLAREGPVEGRTVLDPLGDGVEVCRHYVLFSAPCNEEAWLAWTSTGYTRTAVKTPASPRQRGGR
jgi:hypothetical protein